MNERQLRDMKKKGKKKRTRVYFKNKKKLSISNILQLQGRRTQFCLTWKRKNWSRKERKNCIFASVVDIAKELNKKLSFMNVKTGVFRYIIRTTTPRLFCLIQFWRYCRQWRHCPVSREIGESLRSRQLLKAVEDWQSTYKWDEFWIHYC